MGKQAKREITLTESDKALIIEAEAKIKDILQDVTDRTGHTFEGVDASVTATNGQAPYNYTWLHLRANPRIDGKRYPTGLK